MRIVHILHEFPYPPNSGIRCDMGRRLSAFRALGHQIFAVAWVSESAGKTPSPAALEHFAASVDDYALLTIGADPFSCARRLWNLRRYPSYIASRIPRAAEWRGLMARIGSFAPDLIWLEGVHPCWLALELKRKLALPLAYRSHNIEHRFVAEQARLAQSLRQRLALTLGAWGLEAAELKLHRQAGRVYDISADDLIYWRRRGFANNEWLAPQPDPAILRTMQSPRENRDIDLLFVGSLSSPNNIAGLNWYFSQVHPIIAKKIPDVNVTLAGRSPPRMLEMLGRANGTTLVANPANVDSLFARARVTMNPILHGSGVNLKTIDMLASGQVVVTTAKGARGLPADIVAELRVADTPPAFADAAVAAVLAARAGAEGCDRTALIERILGVGAVGRALEAFAGEAVA